MAETPHVPEAELDRPPERPLLWCGRHEMLHAGQIGLLRRLFGKAPQW